MQSIERYGVIALLFLVVTVVAVLMWDTDDPAQAASSARADLAARPPPAAASLPRPITEESRLEARTEEGPARSARAPLASQERPAWADEPVSDEPVPESELASEAEAESDEPALDGARTIAAERPSPEQADEPKAKPPASAAARPKSERLHLVRPGDTLGEIAEQALGTSRRWPEIAALNPGLDPSNLRVGMRIVLPKDAGGAKPAAAASAPAGALGAGQAPSGRSYRVRAGDSLWRIADRELGDGERWRELVAANRGLNPDKLIVGAVLAIPGTAAVREAAGETVAQTSKPKASARKGRVQ